MTEVPSSLEHLKALRWARLFMQRLNIKAGMEEVMTP